MPRARRRSIGTLRHMPGSGPDADPERFVPLRDPRPDDVVWPELAWPIAPDVSLVGSTVRLDRLDPATDASAVFAALDHPQVWAHLPISPTSVDDYTAFLTGLATRPGWHTWVVRLERELAGLARGAIVGTTSFLDAHVGDAGVEIGATAYTPPAWGTAVNPECKLLLLGHAFDEMAAGRVQIKTDIRNARSQQAIARLGARFEGVLRRHYRRSDGTVRDTVMFSITVEEWPAVRRGLQARLADT